jgi:myo-inositol-1(or 4)-monophosphatase
MVEVMDTEINVVNFVSTVNAGVDPLGIGSSGVFLYVEAPSKRRTPMVELAVACARQAGEIMLRNLEKPRSIEQKNSQATNLVTETDREVEEAIVGMIEHSFPGHEVLAEESGRRGRASDYRWIIDPLDGTTNYAHRLPLFCTSIALEYRGELVVGVIFDPTRNELYSAEKGAGSFMNGRRLQVSETRTLGESLLVTGFPYDVRAQSERLVKDFNAFLLEARALRRLGSAALDLCYVASGIFDGFWEISLKPWDMAAGVLIVQEAGGTFTDFGGKPSTIYNETMLASNGKIHHQMVQVLERSQRNRPNAPPA